MQRTSTALTLVAVFVLGCDAGPAPGAEPRPALPSGATNADQEVLIATVPDGAEVMLSGARVGVTPFRMLVRGNTNIVLEKTGYVRQAILITPESEPNLVVELVADPAAAAEDGADDEEDDRARAAVKKAVKDKAGGADAEADRPAGDGATKEPEAPAPESTAAKAKSKVYDDMFELKQDLRAGKITEADYRRWQQVIRDKRAAELSQLKQDLAGGKLTKAEYEAKAKQIKNKYEGR